MLEAGYNHEELARAAHMSKCGFSNRINKRIPWRADEMERIGKLLRFGPEEYGKYFFEYEGCGV
jgi:hypothetical protein